MLKRWTLLSKRRADETPADILKVARGVTENEAPLTDPTRYPGLSAAADLLHGAVARDEKICIFGDYDADGVCASAILVKYLDGLGADVACLLPTRGGEGYGLNRSAVDEIVSSGAKLLVTVDNGVAAVDEVAYAKSLGLTVIVTDHHLPSGAIPQADAVCDPRLAEDETLFREVCGAQVAFLLCCVMEDAPQEELFEYFGELAAVALIADVMPLCGDNRTLVKMGLQKLAAGDNLGLAALIRAAGAEDKRADSALVAYTIVPRLNAAGRVASPELALRLLLAEDEEEAASLAEQLETANETRKQLEKQGTEQLTRLIAADDGVLDYPVLIISGEGLHEGVLGILAARAAEQYGRPAIILSAADGEATGSGRSVGSFDLFSALASCGDLLVRFGGHQGAAGLTIKTDALPELRQRISKAAEGKDGIIPSLSVDLELSPSELNGELLESLAELEPFGKGNEQPVFFLRDATVKAIYPVSEGRFVRFQFEKDACAFTAICFSLSAAACPFQPGDRVHIAVTIEENSYEGRKSLSIKLADIRRSTFRYDDYLKQLTLFSEANAGEKVSYPALTREDVLTVYAYIKKTGGCAEDADALAVRFPELTHFGVYAALTVLRELSLIHRESYRGDLLWSVDETAGKTDLNTSKLFSLIGGVTR